MPRQFREGLKHSKPDVTDRNIRVKQPHKLATADTHVTGHSWSQQHGGGGGGGGSEDEEFRLNIVYDSENKHLVPYPDGDYIRSVVLSTLSYVNKFSLGIILYWIELNSPTFKY